MKNFQKRPLKIAQIAPLVERIPPKKYGGTERVIHTLIEELVKKGHEVTLFATGDSITSAKLVSVYSKSLREAKIKEIYGGNIWVVLNIGIAYQHQNEFDIIHDHNFYPSLVGASLVRTPVVMTLHGALASENKHLAKAFNKINFVTISHAQSASVPNLNYVGNVYNGLNMENYPFSKKHDNYLLFVGRISREKGIDYAIEAAQYLGLPLIIAAKLETANVHDVQYFHEYVEPHLSEQITWIGEVDEKKRNELMSKAMCLLYPVTWREPFGLVLIEAMACGCPIVAFNKGSIPEVILDGKTGFIVEDVEEMARSIENIYKINRLECRKHALKNFNAERMVAGYEEIYYNLLRKEQFKYDKNYSGIGSYGI